MERSILETLQDRGPLHVMEIADALDDHPVTVDRRCYRLHRRGYIETRTAGVYGLTETGAAYLDGESTTGEAGRDPP